MNKVQFYTERCVKVYGLAVWEIHWLHTQKSSKCEVDHA